MPPECSASGKCIFRRGTFHTQRQICQSHFSVLFFVAFQNLLQHSLEELLYFTRTSISISNSTFIPKNPKRCWLYLFAVCLSEDIYLAR